jgi:hypothetical protein
MHHVRCEHPWPDDRRLDSCIRYQSLDVGVQVRHWIRLLEKGVRRLMWWGQEGKSLRVAGDLLDDRGSGARCRGPYQENCADVAQRGVQRHRLGEVAEHDLDICWQLRRRRLPRERTHRHVGADQLIDHQAPDPAGRSHYQDRSHARSCPDAIDERAM